MKKKNILISTLTPLVLSSAVLPLTNVIGLNQTKNLNYIKTSESTASITDEYGTKWDVKFFDAESEENRYCEVTSFIVGFNKAKEEQLVNKVIIPEKFTFEEKDYKLTKISNCILGTDVKQIEFLTFYDAKNLVEIADSCFKNIKIKTISWVGCYNLKTIGNHAFNGVGVIATKENNIIDLSATVVETIGDYAFYNFSVDDEQTEKDPTRNAWRVILPRTLTKIGDYAFNGETKTVTDKKKQIKGIIEVAIGAALIAASIYDFSKSIEGDQRAEEKTESLKEKRAISKADQKKLQIDLQDKTKQSEQASNTAAKKWRQYDNSYKEIEDVYSKYNAYNENPDLWVSNRADYYKKAYNFDDARAQKHAGFDARDLKRSYSNCQEGGFFYNNHMRLYNELQNNISIKNNIEDQVDNIKTKITKSKESIIKTNTSIKQIRRECGVASNAVLEKMAQIFDVIGGMSGVVSLGFGINNLLTCKYTVDKSIQFATIECLNPEKPTFGKNWAPRGLNLNQNSSIITVPKANSATLNSNPLQDYLNAPNATYKTDGKIENTGKDITPAMYKESKIWFNETSNAENVYKLTGIAGASSTNEFSWKANFVQHKAAHKENQFADTFAAKIYEKGELVDKYHACYSLSRAPENVFINSRTGKISWTDQLKPGTYHFNVNADLFEYVSDPQNSNVLLGSEYSTYVARAQSKEITLIILPNSKLLQIQTSSTITAKSTPIVINFNGKREFDFDYGDNYLKTTLITDHPDKIKIESEKIIIADDVPSGTTFTLNVERKYIISTTKDGTSFETRVVKQSKKFTYTKL